MIFISYSYIGSSQSIFYKGFGSMTINPKKLDLEEYTFLENLKMKANENARETVGLETVTCEILFYDQKYPAQEWEE